MPLFHYNAKGLDDIVIEGELEAETPEAARAVLTERRLRGIELTPRSAGLRERLAGLFPGKDSVKSKDLARFTRQLATLVSSGVPIVRGLTLLQKQASSPVLKVVVGEIRTDIESGLSITQALGKHPHVFPKLYIAMVKAGELGGILDTILDRLSIYLENSEALKAKVRAAMMYPVVVLGICGVITLFLMVAVIPRFQVIFASFGQDLPLLTQTLIDLSQAIKTYFWVFLLAPPVLHYGFKRYYATAAGRRSVDKTLLNLPIFGELLMKAAVARLTRTLSTLVRSGVPMMQALETVAETADNAVISETVLASREAVREGGSISAALEKSAVLPDMVTSMIATGEETGALETMLAKIADFYEQEVDTDIKGLASMIEPVVIVLMGLIVGTIVIAMFLPIITPPDI